jgi:hypothetical protein
LLLCLSPTQEAVISTEAAHSFIVCCVVEKSASLLKPQPPTTAPLYLPLSLLSPLLSGCHPRRGLLFLSAFERAGVDTGAVSSAAKCTLHLRTPISHGAQTEGQKHRAAIYYEYFCRH